MGFTIVTSYRLEALLDQLCEQLTHAPADPLQSETIVVPGQGVARWLELQLAQKLGITAGIDMPFLGAFLHELTGARADTGADADANANAASTGESFRREVLVWRIWRLLTEQPDAFGAASDYCRNDVDGQKRLQLCERLASCFDDYQLYREDLLRDFAAGQDHKRLSQHAPWQAALWRALLKDAGLELPRSKSNTGHANRRRTSQRARKQQEATPFLFAEMADDADVDDAARQTDAMPHGHAGDAPTSDGAHRIAHLCQQLEAADADWIARHLPPTRLTVFGVTTMPPAFLDVLHRIAAHVPVLLYAPQPTAMFIGHIRGRKPQAGDNGLLTRFGHESREFADMLLDLEDPQPGRAMTERLDLDDAFDESLAEAHDDARPNLLRCLQQDVVAAVDRDGSDPDTPRLRLDKSDESLRVHDCHGPQRELEVVRDQILRAFETDPSLRAHDVMVLVPDIDRYAPYAHAVFGPVQHAIPFHVADRHPAREQPLCRTLLAVLDLAQSRLTLAEALHLLESPAVQRRFGLFASDVPVLRHLCQKASIRWGLDGETRSARFDLPAFEDNSWRQGLDRLVLGTLTGPTDTLVHGRLPVGDTTETRSELVARFVTFANTLFAQIAALRTSLPLIDWADRIDACLAALFAADGIDEEAAAQHVRAATAAMRGHAANAGHHEAITPPVLRASLDEALASGAGSRGFLGGSVTIAAMLPMRAVPARCLFVCGLDDESFPRRDRQNPFDLIACKPRPGDRSRRLDDRQLFLDLLLAARDRLHLTFAGRSAKDNAVRAPSVVLSELFEHIDRTCISPDRRPAHRLVVVAHPLQPWSTRYRQAGERTAKRRRPASHDAAANRSEQLARDPRLFTYAQLPDQGNAAAAARHEPLPWCPEGVDVLAAPAQEDGNRLLLDDLLQFWWNPSRAFLREAMRIRVRNEDDSEEADEPFALDGLTRYQIQDDTVRRAQQVVRRAQQDVRRAQQVVRSATGPESETAVAVRDEDALALVRAQGLLPVGAHGDTTWHALQAETETLMEHARRFATSESRDVEFTLAGTELVGTIDGVRAEEITYLRVSRIKPKDRLRAWLLHLVAAIQRDTPRPATAPQETNAQQPWPTTTQLFGNNSSERFVEVTPSDARAWLAELLHWRRVGLTRPLAFFEGASHELARRLTIRRSPEEALRGARGKFWHKPGGEPWQYDMNDATVALCMRDRDPFAAGEDSEAYLLAQTIWLKAMSFHHINKD
ncbi:MAG: exodeoxyribonuclease V subunit gamma [Planctomycetota bacterium]